MGETTSDWLAHKANPIIAVASAAICLALVLAWQFSVKRYIPGVYWLVVTMVSIFGTMVADVLHIGLGIPYIVSTIFFTLLLALAIFHQDFYLPV